MSARDTGLPLAEGRYFYSTGKTLWTSASRAELEALLVSEHPPEFRTILAIHGEPDFDRMTADEMRAVRYSGPAYFDFDGELEQAITAFKAFLNKLVDKGLDLNQVRLFATGGRGFHVEIPPACFVPRGLPAEGVAGLPHVYREIAHELFVNCLDMRVYSAKRGRMWRVPNRQRDNGAYKAPVTADEALGMTPALYADLCSAPREFPALAAPVFCPDLGLVFAKAQDKVTGLLRKRRKPAPKVREALQKRFMTRGYCLPTSLLALTRGHVSPREGAGWNAICTQLAITAHAINMTEEALVNECRRLIDNHQGDSRRYNSPSRREAELRGAFEYHADGLYEFSAGGIRSILPKTMPCGDLEGL